MSTTNLIPTFSEDKEGLREMYTWMFENVSSYIRGRTLLAGPGWDLFLPLLLEQGIPIHLAVNKKEELENFRKQYADNNLFRAFHYLNLSSILFTSENSELQEAFKTIILLKSPKNTSIIKNVAFLLPPLGKLLIQTASFTASYEGLNLSLEDWKEIDRKPIKNFLSGFEIQKTRHSILGSQEHYVIIAAYKIA